MLSILLKVLFWIVVVAAALFVLTFTVYIFNLDMKLMAAVQPFIQKMQEKVKRDRHL